MVLCCLGAKAQTVTKSNEFSEFTAIDASAAFDIVIKQGSPKVDWIVDQLVEDLVQIYQKGNTLVLSFDSKSMTKDQKKYYKGKNAPVMVLKATVYTNGFESLTIRDNVKVDASGINLSAGNFSVSLDDETTVSGLNVNAKNASIESLGKSVAAVKFTAPKVLVKSGKKSNVKVDVDACEDLTVKTDNSATVEVAGNSNIINVNNAGSAKVVLCNGTAKTLGLASKNAAELDASAYALENADIAMVGGKAYVNATKILKLDLKGGSLVSFMDNPSVEIVKVEKSSITRYNGKK